MKIENNVKTVSGELKLPKSGTDCNSQNGTVCIYAKWGSEEIFTRICSEIIKNDPLLA